MTTANAIKKLRKYGKVRNNGRFYSVLHKGEVVAFHDQDGRAICISVRRANDHSDAMTDYFAEMYCDNLSQAIRLARWA